MFDETVQMIERPASWPRRPLLPVKKYIQGRSIPECGIIIEGIPNRVYRGGLYDIPKETGLSDVARDDFATVRDLVAAGWEVD